MSIDAIGIIGAGTMGTGVAINAAQHGVRVTLVDTSEASVEKAKTSAASHFDRSVAKGRISEEDATAAISRIDGATDLSALAGAPMIIEAVFEDLGLKRGIFERLGRVVSAEALVATNTSCLRVDELATALPNPERFLGMHYFNPAAVNPLVEVVRGAATAEATVETADAFCQATAKKPLHCKDSNGFAVNRFFCPYTNEAARLLDEGCGTTARIDQVAQAVLGVPVGPFAVMNMIKVRINLHAIRHLVSHGKFYAPAGSMTEYGEADRPWEIGEAGEEDPVLDRTIGDRLLGGTFLPTLQALDEGVASPADIDMGAQLALKFGHPPCRLMDQLGRNEVIRVVAPLAERYGANLPASIDQVGRLVS